MALDYYLTVVINIVLTLCLYSYIVDIKLSTSKVEVLKLHTSLNKEAASEVCNTLSYTTFMT